MRKPQNERKPVPAAPVEFPVGKSYKEIDIRNAIVYESFNQNVMEQCPNCGRTFLEGPFKIHLKSCTQEKPHRPPPSKVL